jgi:O-antigen/teichoic acid export membrane protein
MVTAALLLSVAPVVASLIPAYQGLVVPVLIIALGQFVLLLNQVFVSVFQLELVMAKASFGDVIGRIFIFILSLLVVRAADPENQLIYATGAVVLGGLCNLLISYLLVRRYIKVSVSVTVDSFRELLHSVLPLAILAVLTVLHFKVDSLLLVFLRNPVEVGIYANSYKIMEILLMLPSMFVGSLFPAFSGALQEKGDRLSQLFHTSVATLLWVVLPLVTFVALFAPYIIAILTRDNVGEASGALQVLSLALVAWFMSSLLSHVMILAKQQRVLVQLKLVMLIVNIALNLVVIPQYGFMGAAWVTVATETVSLLLLALLLKRTVNLQLFASRHLKHVGVAVLVGLLLYGLQVLLSSYVAETFSETSRVLQVCFIVSLAGLASVLYLFASSLLKSLPEPLQRWVTRVETR